MNYFAYTVNVFVLSFVAKWRITARMYIGTPSGCLGQRGAAARRYATSAPRLGQARGRVTYPRHVMRNYAEQLPRTSLTSLPRISVVLPMQTGCIAFRSIQPLAAWILVPPAPRVTAQAGLSTPMDPRPPFSPPWTDLIEASLQPQPG
jgi:hypothetical protein